MILLTILTSAWIAALWVTCIAWLPASLLIALDRALLRLLEPARERSRPAAVATSTAWVVSVAFAALGVFAIPASHSEQLSNLRDGRGDVRVFGQDVCVAVGHDRSSNAACDDADIAIIEADHDF